MNNELKQHIKKMQRRAILNLISTIFAFESVFFGILCVIIPSFAAIAFFAIALIFIVYLVNSNRAAKREEKNVYTPVKLTANNNFSFEDVVGIFENLSDEESQTSTSEDVRFFRFDKIFRSRIILYRTFDFNKKDFDNAKKRINKKANKELESYDWIGWREAHTMMRFNIIYTDTVNDDLYKYMSKNANQNLRRVEGIINIVIVANNIIIPPIYGEFDFMEIHRYKCVVKFINKVLIDKKAG